MAGKFLLLEEAALHLGVSETRRTFSKRFVFVLHRTASASSASSASFAASASARIIKRCNGCLDNKIWS